MDVQLAEAAPEAHVLLVVDVLIPEEEDEMFEQTGAHLPERLVVERFAQVDAVHLRADVAGEGDELDRVVSHLPLRPRGAPSRRPNHTRLVVGNGSTRRAGIEKPVHSRPYSIA